MKKILFLFIFMPASVNSLWSQTCQSVVFNIKAEVLSITSLKLSWNKDVSVPTYYLSRKLRNQTTWQQLSTQTTNDTSYIDNTVSDTTGYEFMVRNSNSSITGYAYATTNLPAQHYKGRILLIIDSSYINNAVTEIKQFQLDLIKEGWEVASSYVGRTQSVSSVKQIIKNLYIQSPATTKGVVLLGHIPVPYSGNINPDGHPDHLGAWPADIYYSDTSSSFWTDISVVDTVASRPENKNIIGDGKFDQSNYSSNNILLFVSRVDVYNMPSIQPNDTLSFKQYLNKNHTFRSAQKIYKKQGLIDDNFGYFGGEAFAQNGWRNFYSLLGSNKTFAGDMFTDTKTDSYLWHYNCGGGWYQGAGGVGSTTDYISDSVQTVFGMSFGSYFGDWDAQDNFLRAPIASPSGNLTNCWAGRPNWYFHCMGLGEPIGFSFLNSTKYANLYQPLNYGVNMIHNALMGDASLNMYPYQGASNLTLNNNTNTILLTWNLAVDTAVKGYYVYRASQLQNKFTLLNPIAIVGNNFFDANPVAGKNIYMVRASKKEYTTTGIFNNLSFGVIDSVVHNFPAAVAEVKPNDIHIFPNPCSNQCSIQMDKPSRIKIFNSVFQLVWSDDIQQEKIISTSAWTNGLYYIQVEGKSDLYKLIVQK